MNKFVKWIVMLGILGGSFYMGFALKEGRSNRGVIQVSNDNPLFAGGAAASSLGGEAQGEGMVHQVRDGGSIQQAVKRAKNGDTIQVYPGTYGETVYVDKDGITLTGIVIDGAWPTLDGGGTLNDAILYSGNNIVVENFRIVHYKGNAIFGQAGNNFVIRNNIIHDTGVYGIFPQFGTNGLITGNVLSGIADAAIYVGMSDNIDVIANEVFDSVAGIEIENSRHALVEGNYVHDNTGGILVFITPGLPIKTTYDVIIRRNFVVDNNTPNFGAPGSIVAGIPAGSGIIVVAGDDVIIEDNIISNNDSIGIGITDLSFFQSSDPDADPNPDRIAILNNVMDNNGNNPTKLIRSLMTLQLTSKGPDIADSGKGAEKCILNGSRYRTLGLSNYFACDLAARSSYNIRTMTLPEPAPPYVLEGSSKAEFEHSLGKRTYYGICSGCHLTRGVLIGPSIEEIQSIYFPAEDGASEAEMATYLQEGAEALATYIAHPVKVRQGPTEMPPQDYLSQETRLAVAKYILTMQVAPAAE